MTDSRAVYEANVQYCLDQASSCKSLPEQRRFLRLADEWLFLIQAVRQREKIRENFRSAGSNVTERLQTARRVHSSNSPA
jgi:hypothetical protein